MKWEPAPDYVGEMLTYKTKEEAKAKMEELAELYTDWNFRVDTYFGKEGQYWVVMRNYPRRNNNNR